MSNTTAERYIEIFADDRQGLLALAACSAALQLDDETACKAIEVIAQSNGSSFELMRRIKSLGCVWTDWNGLWNVSEGVRRSLFDWLYREIPERSIVKLRECLAERASARAVQFQTEDQLSLHRKTKARFEAAYQRILIPERSEEGANEFLELWRQSSSQAAADAIARSVDFLADEILQLVSRPPDALLFLRGMAARVRNDNHAQEKYFGRLWKRARRGKYHQQIHAMAANFLGLLIQSRDPRLAEKALRDSIAWLESERETGLAYLSLGNLLSSIPFRQADAEHAYDESLSILDEMEDRAQVHLALANLFQKNLELRTSPPPLPGDLGQLIELGDDLLIDSGVVIDEPQPSVYEEMKHFARDHYLSQGRTLSADEFLDELFVRFFEAHIEVWKSRAEFFSHAARIMRRLFVKNARTYYTAKLSADRESIMSSVYDFRAEPDAALMALDEALNRLQQIDPDQGRIVELLFYGGLTLEKAAEVLQIPVADVADEWRTAKAFLKVQLTKGKGVLNGLNRPSSMTSTLSLS
ncbi:MAG TPA: ECF-type sigma factor [Pyrinomonadaceae bacterium]|nr:ECF-type sigma factor [Pyrinomonadaceae bacterium]